jgi:hypothetical protein
MACAAGDVAVGVDRGVSVDASAIITMKMTTMPTISKPATGHRTTALFTESAHMIDASGGITDIGNDPLGGMGERAFLLQKKEHTVLE